jgi:hypothetical protein
MPNRNRARESHGNHPSRSDANRIAMLEAQLEAAEELVKEQRLWLSYLYGMRTVVMSSLFWGAFRKFMETRGLEIEDLPFDHLPR